MFKKIISSPIGKLLLTANEAGLSGLHILSKMSESERFETYSIKNLEIFKQTEVELGEYFARKRKIFTVPLSLAGTKFQKAAWTSLTTIPYGKVISYGAQARAMKHASAVRAVGAANGKNPISIIVPCHRVIAANGHLNGYASGLQLKQKLLELEGLTISKLYVQNT